MTWVSEVAHVGLILYSFTAGGRECTHKSNFSSLLAGFS